MRKITGVLLLMMVCLLFCSCGSNSPEDKIKSNIQTSIIQEIEDEYDIKSITDITYNIEQMTIKTYCVSGKIKLKDRYGNYYQGEYDAYLEYVAETEEYIVEELDIYDLIKE